MCKPPKWEWAYVRTYAVILAIIWGWIGLLAYATEQDRVAELLIVCQQNPKLTECSTLPLVKE